MLRAIQELRKKMAEDEQQLESASQRVQVRCAARCAIAFSKPTGFVLHVPVCGTEPIACGMETRCCCTKVNFLSENTILCSGKLERAARRVPRPKKLSACEIAAMTVKQSLWVTHCVKSFTDLAVCRRQLAIDRSRDKPLTEQSVDEGERHAMMLWNHKWETQVAPFIAQCEQVR